MRAQSVVQQSAGDQTDDAGEGRHAAGDALNRALQVPARGLREHGKQRRPHDAVAEGEQRRPDVEGRGIGCAEKREAGGEHQAAAEDQDAVGPDFRDALQHRTLHRRHH